jgi:AsmA protein
VKMTGAGTIDLGTRMMAFRVEPKLVMTTEGQGRAADPVGLGIPVIIDGPWSEPRIYPEMSGILDNPDAAYAKLKEMGRGLFGPNGGGLGALLGGAQSGGQGGQSGGGAAGGLQDVLGGDLGKTLGNLIQQGLGGQAGNQAPAPDRSQSRSIPPADNSNIPATAQPAPPIPAPAETAPQQAQDSPAMNDVLRQLFNR